MVKYFSMFDKVAGQFGPVFAATSAGAAVRQINEAWKDKNFPHAQDMSLYGMFVMNPESGEMITLNTQSQKTFFPILVAQYDSSLEGLVLTEEDK